MGGEDVISVGEDVISVGEVISRSEISDKEGAKELTEEARNLQCLLSFLAATGQYFAECPLFLQYLHNVCRIRGQVIGLRGLGVTRVQ
jgi:hypothetical protein